MFAAGVGWIGRFRFGRFSGDSGSVLRSVRRFRFLAVGLFGRFGSSALAILSGSIRRLGRFGGLVYYGRSVRSVPRFWFSGSAVRLVRRFCRCSGWEKWSVRRFGGTVRQLSDLSAPSFRCGSANQRLAGGDCRLRWFRLSFADRWKR